LANTVNDNNFVHNYHKISISTPWGGSSKYYYNWIKNVAQTGIFIKLYGVEFPSNLTYSESNEIYNTIPEGWIVKELDLETGEIVNEYVQEYN